MVGVVARSGWVIGGGLVLALACGGKTADSDDVSDERGAGGEAKEVTGTTGGAIAVSGGAPVASGGTSAAGETAAGEPGGDGGAGGVPSPSVCGNGIVEEPEECDDGNESETDTCSSNCTRPSCSDGVRQTSEECDDGNANNNDDCLNSCKNPTCGDGILHNLGSGREICDDGEDNGPFPARCSPECTLIKCGNGELDPGDECDDGEANSTVASCLPNCVWNVCGDGYAYLEETPGSNSSESLQPCDDANGYFSDACTDDCQWAVCGDGKLYLRGYGEEYDSSEDGNLGEDNAAAVEECDDGNDLSGDGCDAECLVELNF
jgi:cysteine-rich repeat protein